MLRRSRTRDARTMARLPRLELPGMVQHIVQRGNNRLPCFLDDNDRLGDLQILRESLLASGCQLHAYVLMDNHVHLLITPPEAGGVSRLMQMPGCRYGDAFNARHRRTGTLWERRYKACLVDAPDYLLACYRCIELNPVRARMIESPQLRAWSSHSHNALGRPDPLLITHPCYQALGRNRQSRTVAYRAIVRQALPDHTMQEIRLYLPQQRAVGRDGFRCMVEAKTRRFAGTRPARRPTRRQPSPGK